MCVRKEGKGGEIEDKEWSLGLHIPTPALSVWDVQANRNSCVHLYLVMYIYWSALLLLYVGRPMVT